MGEEDPEATSDMQRCRAGKEGHPKQGCNTESTTTVDRWFLALPGLSEELNEMGFRTFPSVAVVGRINHFLFALVKASLPGYNCPSPQSQ